MPGGFDEDQALALLRRLFGTQTRIYLVRHCESTGNSDHIFQGRVDCGVSENGQKQLDLLLHTVELLFLGIRECRVILQRKRTRIPDHGMICSP